MRRAAREGREYNARKPLPPGTPAGLDAVPVEGDAKAGLYGTEDGRLTAAVTKLRRSYQAGVVPVQEEAQPELEKARASEGTLEHVQEVVRQQVRDERLEEIMKRLRPGRRGRKPTRRRP